MSERTAIGIIGGTGLYQMDGFTGVRELSLETPFGAPSDRLMLGELEKLGYGERLESAGGQQVVVLLNPHRDPVMPLARELTFGRGWGVFGLWIGLSTGLIIVGAVLLFVWMRHVQGLKRSMTPQLTGAP